jgi:hypothetical protein
MLSLLKFNSFKALGLTFALFLCTFLSFGKNVPAPLYFMENKGQISDQNYNARPDILFAAGDGQLVFHLTHNGISYQQYRVDEWGNIPDFNYPGADGKKLRRVPTKQTIYRTDVEWLNCNTNCIIEKEFAKDGYENYYNAGSPNGATNVMSYEQITYKNIYVGIDLKWYSKNGHLKYDYLVGAGVDHHVITLNYKGAKKIFINSKGELVINTPLGDIIEQKPLVKQNGKILQSKWNVNGTTVSFDIAGRDLMQAIIIDPGVRIWGTYYGGSSVEAALRSVIDASGNVYMVGNTSSNTPLVIATAGAHQSTYGGGADNGYMVKFNSAGVRQWGTYYGGPVREFGISVALDPTGPYVYMCGHSLSNTGNVVATPGAHQTTNGGIFDAFLVKFNTSGVRQWGTYYGDTGSDFGMSCAVDANGDVYLTGKGDAASGTVMCTSGAYQTTFGGVEDAFLVKFNSSGVRQWGTLYGSTGTDNAYFCALDASNNIYISGFTDCTNTVVIATPGAHQTVFGGGALDGFVAKFSSTGTRLAGTYYGGSGEDKGYGCAIDQNTGDVYLTGKSSSGNAIASATCQQNYNAGGNFDAFLVRFKNNLTRKWGTFYGASGEDVGYGCYVHPTGHVYLAGYSTGPTSGNVATPGSFQTNYGGGMYDAVLAQYDTAGVMVWGTYYGDTGDDLAYTCTSDNVFNIFLTGATTTTVGNTIATPGAHQTTFGGGFGDGFVVKFYDCPSPLPPTNTTTANNMTICSGGSSTLLVSSAGGTVTWFPTSTGGSSIGSGTTFATGALLTGTYTYYAEAQTCATSASRTAISVTVFPLPNINAAAFPTLVCSGKSTTLTASGATSYTWSNAAQTNTTSDTPGTSTIYTVSGTSTLGCVNSKTISVTVYSLDVINFTPATDTACLFGGAVQLIASPSGGVFSGPNVSGNVLNPTALASFHPVYTYTNPTSGCVNSATATIVVVDCTELPEQKSDLRYLSVYPNPTKGQLSVNTESDKEKTVSITDVRGRVVFTVTSKDAVFGINMSLYANGVYVLKVQTATESKHFKIVKE